MLYLRYMMGYMLIAGSSTCMAGPGDLVAVLNNPLGSYGEFGDVVSYAGTDIIVGAWTANQFPETGQGGAQVGAVVVFDKEGNLKHTIRSPFQADLVRFGSSVAGTDDLIFASATGTNLGDGTVYAFSRETGELVWETAYPKVDERGAFGSVIALASNGGLVVGAPQETVAKIPLAGAAYVLDINTGTVRSRVPNPEPAQGDVLGFGRDIATSGGLIVIGSPLDDPVGFHINSGAAYLMSENSQVAPISLVNPNPVNPELTIGWFGYSLAASEDTVFVSAFGQGVGGEVYAYDKTTGSLKFTVRNPVQNPKMRFGESIAAVGDNLLVGDWRHAIDGEEGRGIAYLIDGDTGEFLLELKDPTNSVGGFGWRVAEGPNGQLLVGANITRINGELRGAVYVFEGVPEPTSLLFSPALLLLLLDVGRRKGNSRRSVIGVK